MIVIYYYHYIDRNCLTIVIIIDPSNGYLCRCYYRFLAGTMFHGGNARMAFPCFDEPEFKAVFEITLTHGQCYKALSNMPIKSLKPASGNMMESQFNQTKKMSTYLIGFIICDYGYAEKNTKSGKRV